jgi:hypothetical protein
MLAPDARAVLLDQLRPPAGYRLDAAVATTFTLDLAAALVPPLAFASFEMRGTPDPVAALEAVRSCTDRVDIFCQAGQMAVPAQASDLMAYLEPMVHAVRRPRPGHLFHPKIWLLRYRSDGEPDCYRLLCLTRNLTLNHSWDAVLRLDGQQHGGPKAGNRPLAGLIRALPDLAVNQLDAARGERVTALAEDVRRVEWQAPNDVNEIRFHVYGIVGVRPTADFAGYRHLVIAPFLTDAGLDTVAPDSPDVTVVSRIDDLERLSPNTVSRITSYVISSIAGLEEIEDDDDGDAADRQVLTGLHAKVYVVERNRLAHVYLGSANATDAAFGGNTEVLVELVGGATKLGVGTFLGPDAPFRSLLEEYRASGGAPPDPLEDARRALEDLLRDLATIKHTITVTEPAATGPADACYTLAAATRDPLPVPDGYQVSVELLTRPGDAHHVTGGSTLDASWTGVPLPDVTPFLAVRAISPEGLTQGTVIRAELLGDPAGRLDAVLARQVDTPEKFLRFLALLLGLGNPHLLAMLAGSGTGNHDHARLAVGPGIFELALRALADQPDAVADLDRLVRSLQATEKGRSVLPAGFDELWVTVVAAHARLTKVGAR